MSTPDDIFKIVLASPPGTIKMFRAADGPIDVQQIIDNRRELANRVEHARRSNCLIEVVSLRLQYIDVQLRDYFENTPHDAQPRQREFGRLLRQCFELGFDKDLYDRALRFNDARTRTIHGYLVGKIGYGEIADAVAKSDGLSEDITEFVLLNSGEPITERHTKSGIFCKVGDYLCNVPVTLAALRGQRI